MRIRTDQTIRADESWTSCFASTSNRKVSFQEGVAKELATPFLQVLYPQITQIQQNIRVICGQRIEAKSIRRSVCHALTNMHFDAASVSRGCDLSVFGGPDDGPDRRRSDRNNQHASRWQ